jgi:branched-chain amino acid transport system substrate-binding protein
MKHGLGLAPAVLLALVLAHPAAAQKKYAPGVSDTEIKVGQTVPYSGPASAYGAIGLAELAYFRMLNDQGGVNGRKITLISLDDNYSPPKTVEQTRKLVEQENVAVIFNSVGTPTNAAVQKYLNEHHVPHLFLATGADRFADPQRFPWTMHFNPSYQMEARIYGRYIREHKPDAKVAVLYQNDDFGKDLLKGLKEGLGDLAAKLVVATTSYEVSDPSIDSQIVSLQASGADTLFTVATTKFAAMSIRKVYDIGWRPLHFLDSVGSAVSAVMIPAGVEKSIGIISTAWGKDPTDARWKDDPAYQEWRAWLAKYNPMANPAESYNVVAYNAAMLMVQVLKQCGDDLSRENIMRQAANLHDVALPMLQPGILINTSPTDYEPVKQLRLVRFDGETWAPFGEVMEGMLTK